MKPSLKFLLVSLTALLLFAMPQPAAAAEAFEDTVIFGRSFTLESGQTLRGNLVAVGGSVFIEAGAVVDGSIVLVGSSLTVAGEVRGDVAAIFSALTLDESAHLHGNLNLVKCALERAAGARIDGQINTDAGLTVEGPQIVVPDRAFPNWSFSDWNLDFHPWQGLWNSLVWAFLAMLAMLFLAPQAERVGRAFVRQPLIAGGVGLLVAFLSPFALILLLVIFPIAFLLAVALLVMAAFGWIALGYEIGQRFTQAIRRRWHPSLAAGLGTFVLTLLSAMLISVPVLNCVGWLVPALLGVAAFGAVTMTRFGTREAAAVEQAAGPLAPQPPAGEQTD
ncbi:MAG: polymer-forming cytoskeletal protein [Anaerolineales bacterium]